MDHLIVPELAAFENAWHFSHVVHVNGLSLLSGVTGTKPDGSVASEPGSSEDVRADRRSSRSYHVGLRAHLDTFTSVKDRHLGHPDPAWSAIGVTELITAGALVELRVVARASVEADRAAGVGVPGPVGVPGTEMDAAEPAVDRRAGGVAGEDGGALGRELVRAVRRAGPGRRASAKTVSSPSHGGSSCAATAAKRPAGASGPGSQAPRGSAARPRGGRCGRRAAPRADARTRGRRARRVGPVSAGRRTPRRPASTGSRAANAARRSPRGGCAQVARGSPGRAGPRAGPRPGRAAASRRGRPRTTAPARRPGGAGGQAVVALAKHRQRGLLGRARRRRHERRGADARARTRASSSGPSPAGTGPSCRTSRQTSTSAGVDVQRRRSSGTTASPLVTCRMARNDQHLHDSTLPTTCASMSPLRSPPPSRPRCPRRTGLRRRPDHAAVAGPRRDAVHRLLGRARNDDQLVRRRGRRRHRLRAGRPTVRASS